MKKRKAKEVGSTPSTACGPRQVQHKGIYCKEMKVRIRRKLLSWICLKVSVHNSGLVLETRWGAGEAQLLAVVASSPAPAADAKEGSKGLVIKQEGNDWQHRASSKELME